MTEEEKELIRLRNVVQEQSKGKNLVIYTALFGSFESIPPTLPPSNNMWHTVIFTDQNLQIDAKDYQVVQTSYKSKNPRLSAKFFKICPHVIFPEYTYSLYIDANCILKPEISDLMQQKCNESLTALYFNHNKRNCAYEEIKTVAITGKESFINLMKILILLKRDKYPRHHGLIQGGFILRQHNIPEVSQMMDRWWDFILTYSERDQLSFNYLAWKNDFSFAYLEDFILHDSPYTEIVPHKSVRFGKNGERKNTLQDIVLNLYFDKIVVNRSQIDNAE